jgi:hypothetical protein
MLTGEHASGKARGRQGFAGGTWPYDVVPSRPEGQFRERAGPEAGKIEVETEKGGYRAALGNTLNF